MASSEAPFGTRPVMVAIPTILDKGSYDDNTRYEVGVSVVC